ncbi:hypothetical protein L0Z11_04820 [Burkholderia multivorans]|uniref:hypothetical protein n=1 Tax=Burkholderia multivorans TaxID=87883 RepID=UPI002018B6C8|nr:hypothetical protein [Burkholderia multivorans]UQN70225.1 hypothetical protein L0Z45_04840 [Burkholderia multivorans]UQN75955.1 hypothetical protein L0Z11_04820 [Burkholderia multivorans]
MENIDHVLNQMATLTTANTKSMSLLGAQAMVLGKFLNAALPELTTLQRGTIARSFRRGIEDAMSYMDDVALPAEYHSTVPAFTNTILAAIDRK